MLVFGTQMHVVTFIFVVLELIMFSYQLIHYLSRPEDKSRYWYMILLILLIVYNITGGLFPDPKLPIPIIAQNITAYGSGFVMASFFPYYFYRALELRKLRFHAIYGVPVFLLLPYVVFFVGTYSINHDLEFAIKWGIVIPFLYSLVLVYVIIHSVREQYKENKNNWKLVATCCAVIPWVSLSVVSYFHGSQLIEVIFTNLGFIVVTILFISESIKKARLEHIEHQQLLELKLNGVTPCKFKENAEKYELTKREVEIVQLIRQGYKYKDISDKLHIAETTAKKHVSNIFDKVGATSKFELIRKLEE